MRLLPVDTAVTVIVNAMALIDDTDFKSREVSIAYNAAGMDLVWNFETAAGVVTQTAVTPTTGGDYDWAHVGDGIYKIEIPASGGASINNDTEGYGWFSGVCDGVLPWAGPTYSFVPAHVVNGLVVGSDNLQVDTVQISGDSTAADNLESATDGTGYDIGGIDVSELNTAVDAIGSDGTGLTEAGGDGDHLTESGGTGDQLTAIISLLPAALVGGRIDANMGAISGSATAADNLEQSALTIVPGAAQTGTLSTTQATTNLTEGTDDHYNNRLLIWATGDLAGQASVITDYDGTSKLLTYDTLTEAPSDGDDFVIL